MRLVKRRWNKTVKEMFYFPCSDKECFAEALVYAGVFGFLGGVVTMYLCLSLSLFLRKIFLGQCFGW